MSNSDKDCFFCNRAKNESIYSSNFLYVVRDNKFPVTKDHTLIAPHRHVSDFFDLNNEELNDFIMDGVADMSLNKGQVFGPVETYEGFHIAIICQEVKLNRIL